MIEAIKRRHPILCFLVTFIRTVKLIKLAFLDSLVDLFIYQSAL